MSRHYIASTVNAIGNHQDSLEQVLAKLAVKQPAWAKKLAGLQWGKIIAFAGTEAIKKVAQNCNATFSEKYIGTHDARGRVLGVLREGAQSDAMQLGLVLDGTKLSFIENEHYYENGMTGGHYNSRKREEWKKAVQNEYRIQANSAMLKILGGEVTREEVCGTTVLKTRLGGGSR